jgi:hypothetical protein
MASELPRADSSPYGDDRDPTYSGPHPLLRTEARLGRPSSRPSAFGPPRVSPSVPPPAPDPHDGAADAPPQTSELRLKRDPVAAERARSTPAAPPATLAPPPRPRHSITTDIEQLLPISQAIKSLPRPPRMPAPETVEPSARRLPWASVGVFVCVLVASIGSLVHYARLGRSGPDEAAGLAAIAVTPLQPPTAQAASAVAAVDEALVPSFAPRPSDHHAVRAKAALRSLVGASWTPAGRTHDPLLDEAHHALAVGDDGLAEALYRELGLVHPGPTAFGLAQVRLAQGDREAAEGWVLRALERRPEEPRYRALYAEILTRAGRSDEARLERALARSLHKRAQPPGR